MAEKATQLQIVIFPFLYTVVSVSDTNFKTSPSLQTKHVWGLIKWGFLFRGHFIWCTIHAFVLEAINP